MFHIRNYYENFDEIWQRRSTLNLLEKSYIRFIDPIKSTCYIIVPMFAIKEITPSQKILRKRKCRAHKDLRLLHQTLLHSAKCLTKYSTRHISVVFVEPMTCFRRFYICNKSTSRRMKHANNQPGGGGY
jgi:hypothetical protein